MSTFSGPKGRRLWVTLSKTFPLLSFFFQKCVKGHAKKSSIGKETTLTRGCDAQDSQVPQLLPKLLPTESRRTVGCEKAASHRCQAPLEQWDARASQKVAAFLGGFCSPEDCVSLPRQQCNSQPSPVQLPDCPHPRPSQSGPHDLLAGSWTHYFGRSPGPGGLNAPEGT